jgi:hypothetical protein
MRLRALSFVLCACVLAGLAAAPPPAQAAGATAQAVAPAAEPRVRVFADYVDTVKVGDHEETRRIVVTFDYDQGIARQAIHDAAGVLLEDRIIAPTNVRPTPEEFAEAVAIVRADRVLGAMFTRVGAVPDGGFLLEEAEGRACGPRTRCLHVFWLSPDRVGLVRWTVVDLVKRQIAYRAYVPPETIEAMRGASR